MTGTSRIWTDVAATINRSGTVFAGEENNEQPRFNNYGVSIRDFYRGCSPYFSLYQNRQASTACDLLANTFFSICSSIQSIRSLSTVTFMRGLFSGVISHPISWEVIKSELESNPLARLIGIEDLANRKSYKFGSGIKVSAFDVPVYRRSFSLADPDVHLNVPDHLYSNSYASYHLLQNKAINSINDIISIICKQEGKISC